jgi:hypothetical protein
MSQIRIWDVGWARCGWLQDPDPAVGQSSGTSALRNLDSHLDRSVEQSLTQGAILTGAAGPIDIARLIAA